MITTKSINNKISIQLLDKSDYNSIEKIVNMIKEGSKAGAFNIYPNLNTESFSRYLNYGNYPSSHEILLGEKNSNVIGFVEINKLKDNIWEIPRIFVDRELRKNDIGNILLKSTLDQINKNDKNCGFVVLTIYDPNEASKALFSKFKFKYTGISEYDEGGRYNIYQLRL